MNVRLLVYTKALNILFFLFKFESDSEAEFTDERNFSDLSDESDGGLVYPFCISVT